MHGQLGMRLCASYRARSTAIFANSTSHPTNNPPSHWSTQPRAAWCLLSPWGPIIAPAARFPAHFPARALTCTHTRRLAQHGGHLRQLHVQPHALSRTRTRTSRPAWPPPHMHVSMCTRTRAYAGMHMSTHACHDEPSRPITPHHITSQLHISIRPFHPPPHQSPHPPIHPFPAA